ncbi:MAG: DEAD/DEAH box helicase family protein [Arcobacter sp.]|uniref:DEAD/DEAH box helicase family protein n=1 Tax=Arcobacter sp. TaxID=1872629 RepID=UPI003D01A1D0
MDRQQVNKNEIEIIKKLSKYITFYEKPKKQTYDENVKADFATLQIEGVAMLINRLNQFNIALLADEVGMGKTFQALAVITEQFRQKSDSKVLVITPRKEVLNQWKEEEYNEFREKHLLDIAETFLPKNDDINIQEVWNFRNGFLEENPNAKIVFAKATSFSTEENLDEKKGQKDFRRDQLIKDIKMFDLIVVDEAHKFRNYDEDSDDSSLIIRTAKMLFGNIKTDAKILLMTATPLHSRIGDFKRISTLFNIQNSDFLAIKDNEKDLMKNIMVRRLRVMSNGKNKYTYRNEEKKDISLTDENVKDYKNELFFAMLQKEYAKSDTDKDLSKSKHLLDFLEGTGFDENFEASDILEDEKNNKKELKKVLKKYEIAYGLNEKPSNNKYEFVLNDIVEKKEKVLVFVRRTASAYELARQYIKQFDKDTWSLIHKAFELPTNITMPENRDEFNSIVNKYLDNDFENDINSIVSEFDNDLLDSLKEQLSRYKAKGEHYKPTALKNALLEYFKYETEYELDKFKKFLQNDLIENSNQELEKEIKVPKSIVLELFKRQKDPKDPNKKKYLPSTHAERFLNKFNSSKKTTYANFFEEDFSNILNNDLYTQNKFDLIKSAVLHASIGVVELYCCDIKASKLSKQKSTSQYEEFKTIVKDKIESFQFVKEINDFLEHFDKFKKYLNKVDEENSKDKDSITENEIEKIKLDASIFAGAQPAFPYVGNTKNKTIIGRFNSPFFPKLLCGTSTLQEGVNLHLFCNKIYHFGSAHTMGDDEQRIGRVDRLMGKMDRELKRSNETNDFPTLDIHYPYLKSTFDEFNLKKMLCNKRKTEKLIDRGTDIIQSMDTECSKSIEELLQKPNK